MDLLRAFSGFFYHPYTIMKPNNKVTNDRNISFYYINTNEIQSEFSRENMIFTCENNMLSSHVKRSPLLWLHNKSRLSHEKCLTEMVLYFIGVYIINRTLHNRLEIRNFSPRFEDISILEEQFRISARPCDILYVLHILP